jgi:uncharacterized protein YvpB
MKKILILVAFAVGFTGAYFKYKPTFIYLAGQIQAKMQNEGRVAAGFFHRLNVPYHRQEHALSCEVASLKMALAGVGVNVPESELIQYLKFDPTPKQNGVWGDPYAGFVGDIDGKMSVTGYGVYWDPIAKLGLRYRRTQALTNGNLQELTSHLDQNHPIVVWGYFGAGNRNYWTTASGRPISAVHGEHARTLIGYVGSSTSPEQLILLDPIYGELYWDTARFMENWAALEYGAVVVYDQARWVKSSNSNTVWELSADTKVKYALAMDWNSFIAQGGVGEGIATVDQAWLDAIPSGGELGVLPLQ